MHTIKIFLIVLPLFLLMDLIWIGVLMSHFYSQELGELARRDGASLSPRWGAAILVYLLIPGGIVLFVKPLLRQGTRCLPPLPGERSSESLSMAFMI